uniref:Uncharacterized protein n=1 Tax=Myotis lucifugus TaxID=59463 RepID=G1QAA4_MYOLU
TLRERDLLRDYLQRHPYSQAYKLLRKPRVTVQSMRNYLDMYYVGTISIGTPRSSRSSLTRAQRTCGCPPSTAPV